jgi:hypothetical protein
LVTPVTMLFTSWRMVPLIALAARESLAGAKLSLPSLVTILTSAFCDRFNVPPVPLTLIWSCLDGHVHASGHGDGHFSYTGHFSFSFRGFQAT